MIATRQIVANYCRRSQFKLARFRAWPADTKETST